MKNPYQILGVSQTATSTEIKSAFRRLAKKYHPDQNQDNPKAKDLFAEVSQAYEILGDKERRAQFDRGEIDEKGNAKYQSGFSDSGSAQDFYQYGRSSTRQGGIFNEGVEDIFKHFFGGGASDAGRQNRRTQQAPQKGQDIKVSLFLSLEQIFAHQDVEVAFPDGRRLKVKLPTFLQDGQVIRLKGQGGDTDLRHPGDALLTIRFKPHPVFTLKGQDLYMDLNLPLRDAVLGSKQEIQTLDGRVSLQIPAWTNSGKIFRLSGKGLFAKNKKYGDLYVKTQIILPEKQEDALIDLMKKW